MKIYQVEICDCCERKYSAFGVPVLAIKHRKELSKEMAKQLVKLKVKGSATLFCVDGLITDIEYRYANDAEVLRSERICSELEKAYLSYFDDAIENSVAKSFAIAA